MRVVQLLQEEEDGDKEEEDDIVDEEDYTGKVRINHSDFLCYPLFLSFRVSLPSRMQAWHLFQLLVLCLMVPVVKSVKMVRIHANLQIRPRLAVVAGELKLCSIRLDFISIIYICPPSISIHQ